MCGQVNRPILHQCTKFSKDRPNRCRYIAIFAVFKMAAAAILDFQKLEGNFNSRSAVRSKCESPCQISSKSVKQLQRYGDLTVSKLLFHLSLTDQHHPYTGIETDRGAEKCLEEAEKAFQNSDS